MVNQAIAKLAAYALQRGLIEPCEYTWAVNSILGAMKISRYEPPSEDFSGEKLELSPILDALLAYACEQGLMEETSVVFRGLFDTELMGRLTPGPPRWWESFGRSTRKAPTEYGDLDITINLSKPEKDPKAIAEELTQRQIEYIPGKTGWTTARSFARTPPLSKKIPCMKR